MGNTLMIVFLVAVIGYLVGSIKIRGVELGTAGVLLVALVFGHFGFEVPDLVRELGLICFVTSVGFIAGPKFFRNFKINARSYILLGAIIIIIGALTTIGIIEIAGVPSDVSVGMMAGALTSTPGLAAAIDATGSVHASVGYGIAYPFGVVGVVLFVQLVPKFLKTDMAAERARFEAAQNVGDEEFRKTKKEELFYADSMGFFPFALAIVLGIILAKIVIPLPGGAEFSLGTSGGPLIAGLILGHFGKIGRLSMKVEKHVLECLREFGLALFLIGAGVEAGAGFVEILREEGLVLFIYGALITLIPMLVGYFFAAKVLKLSLFNSLGSICGGMTSTPALGTLIRVTETDDVASAYAATYPVALVFVVLGCQFIGIFL
ncbi:permease [Massilistercora timonensis]|uniref:aspartate-alanine antiporter-like transporter n=1 Tax=Massilistercora timonensis TaxID=2086584 RepID=UPI003209A815